jgi:hypothetical protein
MARRGWANSTVTAVGAAAGAGAAQLGLGYGLGVVAWQPATDVAGEAIWLASLAWVLWIGATSTVIGAVFAHRSGAGAATERAAARRTGRAVEVAWRVTLAVAGAIGALITVPLVMLPARAADRVDNFEPQVTAGAYAVLGVIIGLLVAIAAVNVRVIATNVVASALWVWVLGAVSVVDAVGAGRTAGTAQLATWQFVKGGWFGDSQYVPGALIMLAGALLVGVVAALPADRRAEHRIWIAVSGVAGPLLVAAAYFLTAPQLTVPTEQLTAYLFAAYAVLAGLAGSSLVAALGPLRPRRPKPTGDELAPPAARREEPKREAPKGEGAKRPEPVREAETTVWLDAKGTDPVTDSPVYPAGEAGVPTTVTEATTPTATGRATVTQPLWPEKPRPRKRRP